jgi:hypothetical protein
MKALKAARRTLLAILLIYGLSTIALVLTHSLTLFWPVLISAIIIGPVAVACVGIQLFLFVRRRLKKQITTLPKHEQ